MIQINPLTSLQTSVVEFIGAALPMLKSCEAHYGRFTAEELDRIRTHAPAIHIGLPAIRNIDAVGEGLVRIEVMTYIAVITKDAVFPATDTAPKRKLLKDEAMAAILSSLFLALPNAGFGSGVQSCEGLAADNLTTAKVSKDGVAMWGLHWKNVLTISAPEEPGATLASLFFSWSPDIGPDHIEDYTPLAGGAS